MKIILGFILGALFAAALVQPASHFEKVERTETKDTIVKIAYDYTRQASRMPGKFEPGVMEMLEQVLQVDSSRIHTTPDSSNTRIFSLNAWPIESPVMLIETYAGNAGGSCGANILICRFSESTNHWFPVFYECGGVDTVLPVSHNGLFDFIISDKWDQDHYAFRYDGKEYVDMKLATPPSDEMQLQFMVGDLLDIPGYHFDLAISYLELGTDSVPYILVGEGISNKYLFTRSNYGELVFVCDFPEAVQVDFLETYHNNMPDVRVWDYPTGLNYYQWNGSLYVKTSEEIWVPS